MATISNVLSQSNPVSQMRVLSNVGPMEMGNTNIVFNPTQRLDNQLKTASQVMNYATSKSLSAQGRTDMRGNIVGYSDTLG
jgi:hypothetical protein